MSLDVLIVGQGLAGTLLAWELERAGIAFRIVDEGGDALASVAGAGIINPITGRRLVKSWRVEELRPLAREIYRDCEEKLGLRLWHDMRVRRLFADETERATFATKHGTGELAPFVGDGDADGFWINGAARVDVQALLAASRMRWQKAGRWRAARVNVAEEVVRHSIVIDCRGQAGAKGPEFDFVPWEFSKGEVIEVAVEGLQPDVIFNRRHWVMPVSDGVAWVGATHEPGRTEAVPTAAARHLLETSTRSLLVRPFTVMGQRAGVRVNLPDKRPVVGRHLGLQNMGLLNGLGAKGTLWAPWLARMWAEHLCGGRGFDAEVDVGRFSAWFAAKSDL